MAYHQANESGGLGDFIIGLVLVGLVLVIVIPLLPVFIAVGLTLAPYLAIVAAWYYGAHWVSQLYRDRKKGG